MNNDVEVQSEADLHQRLEDVITRAYSNGVSVRGSYPVINEDTDLPDWDVEIVRLDLEE